jgi:hypothetical protein
MRSVKVILLLACVALAGCSKPAPSAGYTDKDKLIQDYVAAVKAGDTAKYEAMLFKEGLSEEAIALNKIYDADTTQFALTIPWFQAAPIKRQRLIEELAPLPQAKIAGRPLTFVIPPTMWVEILFEPKTADLSIGSPAIESSAASRFYMTLPLLEHGGKYWIAPFTYETLPAGVELSKSPEVSIVYLETRKAGEGGFLNKSRDGQIVTSWKMDAVKLSWALGVTDAENKRRRGLARLPAGDFKIEVKNLPKPLATVHRELIAAYEASFGVKITTEDYAWDGWLITPPQPLPAIFTKSGVGANPDVNTVSNGYAFQASVLDAIGDRIEGTLNMPVEFSHPYGNQRYDFTIVCNISYDDGLLNGLKGLGFKIEPKKLTRKTTVITPAK